MKKSILLLLMIGLSLTAFSQKWEKTVSKNTVNDYQKFVQKNPKSEHVVEALERMLYLKAVESKEDLQLKAYLEKYPNTSRATNIKEYYSQLQHFNDNKITSENYPGTYAARREVKTKYLDFIKKYNGWPGLEDVEIDYYVLLYRSGESINSASPAIQKAVEAQKIDIDFEKIIASTTMYKMTNFIKKYPSTSQASIMQDTVDAINARAAKKEYLNALESTSAMRRFVKKYPNAPETIVLKDTLVERDYIVLAKDKKIYLMENFVTDYPSSSYISDVKGWLYDSLYAQVNKEKSYKSYSKFLKYFPDSQPAEKLKSEIYGLHLDYARTRNSERKSFLDEYPNSPDREEIECLIACNSYKKEDIDNFKRKYPNTKFKDLINFAELGMKRKPSATRSDYEAFLQKYPNSLKIEAAKAKINNYIFSERFNVIISQLATKWGSDELLSKINIICQSPSNYLSYTDFRKFQTAMTNFKNYQEKVDKNTKFLYGFVELCYHVGNAVNRSMMNMMMESMTGNSYMKPDPFKMVTAIQGLIDMQLVMIAIDEDVAARHRGYQGIENILKFNSLHLSKLWSEGEKVSGFQLIAYGTPVNIKQLKGSLEALQKIEKDSANLKIIKGCLTTIRQYVPDED